MSMLSFSAGGINVADIVSGFMAIEQLPLQRIEQRQADVRLQATALDSITTNLTELRTQALTLTSSSFSKFTATSSSAAVTASIGAAATTGSITFTVDQVARAHGLRTSGTVATEQSQITSQALLAVSSTTSPLGIGTVRAGAGLAAGPLDVTVTQATNGAVVSGTTALAASTVLAAPETLDLLVDGAPVTVTIAAGTYTPTELAAAVDDQLASQPGGAPATASLDASGRLRLTSTHEGSAATLEVTGGTALGALGLTTASATGTDGVVTVGTGSVTVTSARPGESVTVDTGAGEIELDLAGGLRVGTAKVAVVSTGDGSLASVAGAINGAGVGVSAAAVRVGDGAWTLQLSSGTLGVDGTIAIDQGAFATGLVETSAAQDASITIGSGPGQYSITGAGNSFGDVLPGVVLNVAAATTEPVTVDVRRDDAAAADAVQKLVDRANTLLAQIAVQTRFDPETRVAGPLSGQSVVRNLANDVRRAISDIVPGGAPGLASLIGITNTRDGKIEFDRAAFLSALADDPDAIARMFGHGGTGTEGVAFSAASDKTVAGEYAVVVTQAATRAATATVLTGGSPGVQQLAVRVGDTTVEFEAAAGATANEIADGLRTALSGAGLAVDAVVDGGQVSLRSVAYGTAGSFEFSTDPADPGAWQTAIGTDAAGTIDGQTAIGVGNTLRLLETSTSGARGLAITVAEGFSEADLVPPAVSTITYEPGIAARVAALGTRMTSENGSLTITERGFDDRIEAFNDQIDRFEERLERVELRLIRQWSSIQTMLQSLQSQGDWLGGQIASMSRAPSS